MRRYGLLLAAVWFVTAVGQASVGPEAEVKIAAGRVKIKATATPVSGLLDRLSRTTGMKVVYEGPPPSERLTVAIDAGSETEALSRLLEGLGLTYAFKLDASGRHVETLFVTSGSSSSSSSSSRRASSSSTHAAPSPVMAASPGYQETDEDAMADDPPPPEPDPALQQADASGMVGGSPGYVGGTPMVGAAPGVDDQAPAFPDAASFPSSSDPAAPFPGAPVAPGPASFPSPNVGL